MKSYLFVIFLVALSGAACAAQYVVADFSFWCLNNTQPIEGDCLRWGDADTDVSPDGLWHFGFMYEGNMVGWAKNEAKYLGIGYMSGFYSSELPANERPDEIYLIHDVLGDGIGLYDSGTGAWYLGDDDVLYAYDFEGGIWDASQNILFGPDEVRGDLSYLPARGSQSELPQMIIDIEIQRDIPGDYTGQYGVNLEDFSYLANNWLSTQITGGLQVRLTASDADYGDYFGGSVSIDGNIAIVGAFDDDDNGSNSGSAYLFDVSTESQTIKLVASDLAQDDRFGYSVDIDGNTAIIGAPGKYDGGSSGSAYLFDIATGSQLAKLIALDAAANDCFGMSVALDGNIAIVGAYRDDDNGSSSGSAYLFDITTNTQLMKLTASDAITSDFFGRSVAMDGNIAIIGAPGDDVGGSAYLFDVATGNQLIKLTASDTAAGDNFGKSVSISGNTAIVGALADDDAGASSGSAYLFDVTNGSQLAKLTASDATGYDYFGTSVSISGNIAIIGAYGNDDGGTLSGSAYLFDATTGNQLEKLTALDASSEDYFGHSVAVDGDAAIIGAYGDGGYNGAAYLFELNTKIDLDDLLILCDHWLEGIVADTIPPEPNPATFSSPPTAISQSSITMTATVGTDTSGPVEYYFSELTGNPGGSDSGWQLSETYVDNGLDPNTQYTYNVQIRDSVGNSGTASNPASATTLSATDPPVDMIAYWSFDNTADLGHDDSENGHDGFVYEAQSIVDGSRQALSFDGINDYMDSNFLITDISAAKTINFWMKTTTTDTSHVFSCYDGSQYLYVFLNRSDNTISYGLYDGANVSEMYATNPVYQNGNWHMITVVQSGPSSSDVSIYIDGTSQSLTSLESGTINSGSLQHDIYIGARNDQGTERNFADVDLDEIKVWSRALSGIEIQTLYQNP